jgi:hypothetical protein
MRFRTLSLQRSECSGSVRTRHWRPSTIGSSVIEFDDRQKDPEIDCHHGGVRLASSVTGYHFGKTDAPAMNASELKGENPWP